MLIIEFSAVVHDKREMLDIYRKATEQPFSFLYINLKGRPRFYVNFQQEILLEYISKNMFWKFIKTTRNDT